MKFGLLLLILFALLSVSQDSMLRFLGLAEHQALAALVVSALMAGALAARPIGMCVIAVILTTAASAPAEAVARMGYDRDYAIALLISVLLTPYIVDIMDA